MNEQRFKGKTKHQYFEILSINERISTVLKKITNQPTQC